MYPRLPDHWSYVWFATLSAIAVARIKTASKCVTSEISPTHSLCRKRDWHGLRAAWRFHTRYPGA